MPLEPTITFRGLRGTGKLETDIRTRLANLERYCPSIIEARVIVERAMRHHRDGNRFHVRIELGVPGEDVIITHEASLRPELRARAVDRVHKADELDPEHRHAKVAVREAFEAARRRLQDYTRHRRGAVKTHTPPPAGRIARLFPSQGYGFIEAADGHEVYFQQTSVLDRKFERMKVGSRVAFVEEPGRQGPQASTVRLVR